MTGDITLALVRYILLALIAATVISFAATPLVKKMAYKVGAIDVPKDNRRMHKVPIPRLGGLAIFLGFFLSVLLFAEIDRSTRGILIGAVMIVILGVLDDILTLRALPKFLVQIAAAGVAVYYGNVIIDGLDGLAVGVSAISSATLLVTAILVSEGNVAIIMAALLGACLGFIPYNMNPAKIFMGDTGSTFLGYILATLSIQGLFKLYAIISFAVPFLILGLPIFDICFAILRRLAHGQNPMKADRGHIHHRLIDMGFNQKQTVAIAYMVTAILGLAAVVLTSSGALRALFLIGSVIVVGAIGLKLIFASRPEMPDEKQGAGEENGQPEADAEQPAVPDAGAVPEQPEEEKKDEEN